MLERIQTAVAVLYPPRCLGCGEIVESDFGLCPACWRDTPFISGAICDSCGVPVPGQADGHRILCDDCLAMPRPWTDGRAVFLYDAQARRLILALKHGDRTEIARPAARWMARAASRLLTDRTVIAPVPLHWSRFLRRRYNQSALLAQALGRIVKRPVCPDLLIRTRRTPMLEGMTSAQRRDLLEHAIRLNPRHVAVLKDSDVLLVDDVMTTGATLAACARACHDGGAARVDVVVLARVAKDT